MQTLILFTRFFAQTMALIPDVVKSATEPNFLLNTHVDSAQFFLPRSLP